MTLAMAGFAIEDGFLKAAARVMPMGQAVLAMGLLGVVVFGLVARRRGEAALPAALFTRGLALRSGFELAGRLFHALALALTPLVLTSAILQAAPLVVVAGAALVFGERVGPRRWLAVGLGMAGVLVILRPGLEGFDALALLPVAGMLGFACRDLATRAAPRILTNAQLGVAGFAVLALSGALILAVQGGATWPGAWGAALVLAAAGIGVASYAALTGAMRSGALGAVAPFRYTRLVFAMVLGIAVFGERPDALTLLGSAVIVAAGLLALWPAGRAAKSL